MLDPVDFDEIDFDAAVEEGLDDDENTNPDFTGVNPEEEEEDDDASSSSTSEEEEDEEEQEEEEGDREEEEEDEETAEEDDDEEDKEEDEDEDGEPGVVDTIKEQFGFDFGEEEFEDTEDGLIKLAMSAAEKKAEQLIENTVKDNPEAGKFWEYLQAGGDPAKYIQTMSPNVNYLEIEEIDGENVALQERLVRDYLSFMDEDEETINDAIEEYKTAGILEGEARRSLSRLQREQKSQQDSLLEEQRQIREQQIEEQEEYFGGLREKIDKSKNFRGLPITEKEKDPFFAFIEPDENGVSEYAKAARELDAEELLAVQFLVFKGFDLEKLIDTKAKTTKAKTLKEQLEKNSGERNVSNSSKRDRRSSAASSVNVEELNLDLPG